eukprot:3326139-Prymnesium_polylepis.1
MLAGRRMPATVDTPAMNHARRRGLRTPFVVFVAAAHARARLSRGSVAKRPPVPRPLCADPAAPPG